MQPVIQHRNSQIEIDLAPLLEAQLEETFLTEDSDAADVTLTVRDIDGFAISQFLVIGELGEETCEIVKVHASTAPAGTTVTLVAGGLEFAHAANTRVRRIQYDQVELSHSATEGGSKSVLVTANLQVDQFVQTYVETAQTTGYYFARFKDSTAGTFSGYTDPCPYGGWDQDTVGSMIDQALRDNLTNLANDLSRGDCYQFITDGINLVMGKQLHHPQQQQFNYVAGQTSRGINVHALPATMYDQVTNQSVRALRIGEQTLSWVDPDVFSEVMRNVRTTQVRTQASVGAVSLAVDNSYDFDESGSINVYVSGVKYTITYTGVTRDATGATAAFTGIPASGDGSISVILPVDTNVWQGESEGIPEYYTFRNGNFEYYPLPDQQYDNFNLEMDFWTVATVVNSDGDAIDVTRYSMLLDYLRWRVRMKVKNGGALNMEDGFYKSFKEQLNDYIRVSRPMTTSRMSPRINTMRRRRGGRRPNIQNLSVDEQ